MALVRAKLEVLDETSKQPKPGEQYTVDAQFNPQTLTVTYHLGRTPGTNTTIRQVGTQGASEQQTGYTADVSMDLLFDTSQTGEDVRKTTLKIAAMIKPDLRDQKAKETAPPVPVVRFSWGTFIFSGNIQSMTETLDFFSEQGVPLRATVKLGMSEVSLERSDTSSLVGIGFSASVGFSAGGAGFSVGASLSAGIAVGTTPLTLSQSGDTLQSLAGRAGASASWKAIASANNIDNPRLVDPGTVLNLNARAQASAEFNT